MRSAIAGALSFLYLAISAESFAGRRTLAPCWHARRVCSTFLVAYSPKLRHDERHGKPSCFSSLRSSSQISAQGGLNSERCGAWIVTRGTGEDGASDGMEAIPESETSVAGRVTSNDDRLEELWRKPKKHLMSIGREGVKHSHRRSLVELVKAHSLVKVKVIPKKGVDIAEAGRQLCERVGVEGGKGGKLGDEKAQLSAEPLVGVIMIRPSSGLILFGEAEFVKSLELKA
ncbi:unnamed protein product [Choristocarpus tenellus]